MKYLFLITLLTYVSLATCQTTLKIEDSESGNPITYAHVLFFKGGVMTGGTYTDSQGEAVVIAEQQIDAIEVSHLAYETLDTTFASMATLFLLKPKTEILLEATVQPAAKSSVTYLGLEKNKRAQSFTAYSGLQLIALINNPSGNNLLVKSSHFQIGKLKTTSTAKLRLIFFENNNGVPGKQLDTEYIIETESIGGRKAEIFLDSANLQLPPNGFFAGIEWMGCVDDLTPNSKSEDCQLAIMVNHYPEESLLNVSYIRNVLRTKEWQDLNEHMMLDLSMIPVFGISVYE